MKKAIALFLLCGLVLSLNSCIEEYALPEDFSARYTQQMYIEGKILSGGESIVYVMKTMKMNEHEAVSYVGNAKVYIMSDNGFKTETATYTNAGAYIIQTGVLNDEYRYKLVVEYGGNVYESSYQKLQPASSIDEIGFTEDPENNQVKIWVSSHGDNSNTPYFMWTFEEDFEYHALMDMREWSVSVGYLMYSKEVYPDVTPTVNPYYYCWTHRDSHDIMLYSSDVLSENTVKEHVVKTLTLDTPDLQHMYCLTLYQSNLSEEAYEYYSQMKSNTEEMGSLFAPMPKEVYGNITCTNNPDIKVRGFISASCTVMKRLFIHASDLKNTRCSWVSGSKEPHPMMDEGYAAMLRSRMAQGFAVVALRPDELTDKDDSYTPSCINCLLSGGTKEKPEWWPNDDE